MPDTSFAARLRAAREARGLSPLDLGARIGKSDTDIRRWERGGVKSPAGETVATLARALWTTADYLLGLTDEMDARRTRVPGAPDGDALSDGSVSRPRQPKRRRSDPGPRAQADGA